MDTLTTYVDNTFSAVPQTEEIKKLKSEILNRMLNRYSTLKSEGKSDNEITGIIISEFSNISQLINEQVNLHDMNKRHSNDNVNITFNDESLEYDKNARMVKALLSGYWPFVVVFYFLFSYIFRGWGFSWLIFPLAVGVKKFFCSYYGINITKKH